ncbi:M penetrans family 1 protein [Chryseobacterium sp. G0162]|nr:M penetrans family 1 protein [Chryseobacterium sp. G0162]RXM52075.1 M penetrans family 1 protein [Chryseobacterium sp. CH25]RXM63994.1 M penetrans family 1 protein [Chryseobacterium sp. CH1]UHO38056.1 M penetrans family 1 protein [Chryseobacterium capnotolerans]
MIVNLLIKMKKLLYISGILTFFVLMSFMYVDFFSSMTKVDYIDGSKTLKFTTKMNTSHISDAIKINPNTAGFEAEVKKYVNNNFDVFVNGAPKTITFTGSQISGETVWVYFETGGVSDINTLKIKNTILLSSFPKQINLVSIAYKGSQKMMNFQRGKEVNEVSF